MPDPLHLAELEKGVKNWNRWRRENPSIVPDLRKADLTKFDLREIDLSQANLSFAKLNGINLNSAKFVSTNLNGANLSGSDLSSSNLNQANLQFSNFTASNLSSANLNAANLKQATLNKAFLNRANLIKTNLTGAYLSFANLSEAKLIKADLSLTVMRAANLQSADLSAAQALETNFTNANFTGACLFSWNINSKTKLDSVQCDYIYLKKKTDFEFSDRFPNDGTFQLGEFSRWLQQVSGFTELFFTNGITEFIQVFKRLQQNCTNEIFSIQTIEQKKGDGLSVRLEVLPEENQEVAKKFNAEQLQLAKATYELQTKSQIIELQKQHHANLMELVKHFSKPTYINVEANAMSNSEKFTNNVQGANIANFANQIGDNARQQANQYNYSAGDASLADVAQEIQALLDQLSQNYPTDTTGAKLTFANEAVQRIDNNFLFSQRILSALSAGSVSALEQFLNHPAASFFISMLEDWKKTRVQ